MKPAAARFGDWLGRIGWGKFFLLSILLLILGGISTSLFVKHTPMIIIDDTAPPDRVDVTVKADKDGIRIAPGKSGDVAKIKVDDKGVRLEAKDKKETVAVVIDEKGVRIERGEPKAADAAKDTAKDTAKDPTRDAATDAAKEAPAEGEVAIPAQDLTDPEKTDAAVEAARARIEQIVADKIQKQVARQVARQTRKVQESRGDWIMSFVMLLIVSLIIVKIAMGSKRKAETKAQAATATAAEESLKRQLAEAQLKTMQAQVEPHFLFNTLASVDYLIETDPPRASAMQKNLIQYLRAALPQMREASSTLGKEVDLCRAYLEILKVRMEDRLQVAITVPQGLASATFPPMMLQSLVENAIKHGLEPKCECGQLTLTADVSNGKLRVMVADTGVGFSATTAGGGVGLANIRERLAALYGGEARLTLDANSPTGTIATIEVPYVVGTMDGAAQNKS